MDRQDLLDRLSGTPGRLAALAAAAGRSHPAGEWSTRDIVRHLIAVEDEVWLPRLVEMADGSRPHWSWTEPGLGGHEGVSLDPLLDLFRERRRRTVNWLAPLGEAGWSRAGTHSTFGELDVAGLMAVALDHDETHLEELERRVSG